MLRHEQLCRKSVGLDFFSVDCGRRYVITQVNAISPVDMDFDPFVQKHMADLMGDRKPLPVRVMERIHTNDYAVFISIDHARYVPINGRIPHLCPESCGECLDRNRWSIHFVILQYVPDGCLNPWIRHEV